MLKMEKVATKTLEPGDKIFLPGPKYGPPLYWKLPDILTVQKVDNNHQIIDIEESGGLNIKIYEIQKVLEIPEPKEGETISFKTYNREDPKRSQVVLSAEIIEIMSGNRFKVIIDNQEEIVIDKDIIRIENRKCRVCGCTHFDCSQCIKKTGAPCFWIEEDLCSACEE